MFSFSIFRFGRSNCACRLNRSSSNTIYQRQISTRPCHQRRYSSSNAPVPPKRGQGDGTTTSASTSTRPRGRKAKTTPIAKTFANLPSVPTTSHLDSKFINISSFFSLHRPISLTQSVPKPSSEADFATIFEPLNSKRHNPARVLSTIEGVVGIFEGGHHQQQNMSSEEAFTGETGSLESEFADSNGNIPSNVPMDLSTHLPMQLFRPFHAPPAPNPVERKKQRSRRATSTPKSRQWQTTIVLTETTFPSGHKSYSASGTPLERLATRARQPPIILDEPDLPSQPSSISRRERLERFRHKSNIQQPTQPETMIAISVKRQRKLKMKKKKYKKLMKRTRNERRKLGKL